VGLQALPLHQFEYLLSYLRLSSIAHHARHRRKFARSVDDSRCADTRSALRCSHPAACNGAPRAEASLQHRWSVGGRTVPNHHTATSQLSYALRAKRSIERWA
jgi:hypothetical protein